MLVQTPVPMHGVQVLIVVFGTHSLVLVVGEQIAQPFGLVEFAASHLSLIKQ